MSGNTTRGLPFPVYNPARPGAPIILEADGGTITRSVIDDAPAYRNPAKYRLAIPSGVTGMASVSIGSNAWLRQREHADLAVRLRIIHGNGSANARLLLAIGRGVEVHRLQPEPGHYVWTITNGGFGSLTDQMGAVALYGNGAIEGGYVTDGSYTALTNTAGPGSSARTAEAGVWLRYVRSPLGQAWWWGVAEDGSTDALPTRWKCALISQDTDALNASVDARSVRITAQTLAGVTPDGFVVDVLDAANLGPHGDADGTRVEPDYGEPFVSRLGI